MKGMKRCFCIGGSDCNEVIEGEYYYYSEGRFYNTLYLEKDVRTNRLVSIQVSIDDFDLYFAIDDDCYEEITNLFFKIMDDE